MRPRPRSPGSPATSRSRSSPPPPDPTAPGPCAWLSTWRWRRTGCGRRPSRRTSSPTSVAPIASRRCRRSSSTTVSSSRARCRRPSSWRPCSRPLPRPSSTRRGETLLFAYGTLMRGLERHRFLAARTTLIGRGTVRGRLLSLGRYPGIVDGGDRVTGELYQIDDEELLPAVDREEGYNFLRRRAVVTLTDGRRARAWIYRYRGPREHAAVIPAGDWRNRWR